MHGTDDTMGATRNLDFEPFSVILGEVLPPHHLFTSSQTKQKAPATFTLSQVVLSTSMETLICMFRDDFMHFNNSIKFICFKLKNFQLLCFPRVRIRRSVSSNKCYLTDDIQKHRGRRRPRPAPAETSGASRSGGATRAT